MDSRDGRRPRPSAASTPAVAPARPSQKVHASTPPSSATTSVNPSQPEALDSVEQARVMLAQATLADADVQDVVEPAARRNRSAIRAIERGAAGSASTPRLRRSCKSWLRRRPLPPTASTAATTVAPALAAVEATMANARVMASTVAQTESSSQHESNGNWIWSNNGEKLPVSYDGTFEFTDDDQDIRQISPGGYLKISDGAWFGRHTVEIRERGGKPRSALLRQRLGAAVRAGRPAMAARQPAEVRAQHRHRRRPARRAIPEIGRPVGGDGRDRPHRRQLRQGDLFQRAVQAGDAQRRAVSSGDGAGVARDEVGLRAGAAAHLDRRSAAERRAVARRVFRRRRPASRPTTSCAASIRRC